MKTFAEGLPQFLSRKQISVHPKTYNGYVSKTKVFSLWLKDHGLSQKPLGELTNDNIADFFVYIARDRDLDRPTCEKYCNNIKAVFQFFEESEGITKLPFRNVSYPIKKRDCAPKYIPKEKQKALLDDIRKNDPQLFLACMCQYSAAIRPGREMLNLKVKDFDFSGGTIKVSLLTAKTGKSRYADFTTELMQYCREYGIENADRELYVFGKKGKMGNKPISENMLRYRFNQFRAKHGISTEVKLYSLKHTGLTDLINSKLVSLPQLQKHCGHTRLSSTEHYILVHAGVTNEVIRNEFRSILC
jgi:site-specific recombinase XerD